MPNRYMIIRIKDERSSHICASIEQYALERGGLEFPFSHEGRYYDTNNLVAGLHNPAYYTEAFHTHCRCTIVPINKNMFKDRPEVLDEIDMDMLVDSSLAYSANEDVKASGEVPLNIIDRFLSSRIFTKMKMVGNLIRRLFA
jgi:hypothetical protein